MYLIVILHWLTLINESEYSVLYKFYSIKQNIICMITVCQPVQQKYWVLYSIKLQYVWTGWFDLLFRMLMSLMWVIQWCGNRIITALLLLLYVSPLILTNNHWWVIVTHLAWLTVIFVRMAGMVVRSEFKRYFSRIFRD